MDRQSGLKTSLKPGNINRAQYRLMTERGKKRMDLSNSWDSLKGRDTFRDIKMKLSKVYTGSMVLPLYYFSNYIQCQWTSTMLKLYEKLIRWPGKIENNSWGKSKYRSVINLYGADDAHISFPIICSIQRNPKFHFFFLFFCTWTAIDKRKQPKE